MSGKSRRPRQRRPAQREAEPVLAADLLPEAATGEVVPRERAGLRLPEVPLVEARSSIEQGEQTLAATPARVLLRRRLLVLDPDVEAVGEPLDRTGEVELLGLADEGDQVSLGAAAEAVVELVGRVDREARRAFLVEGAAAGEAAAHLAELRPVRDHGDHVGRGLDLLDGGVLDAGHQRLAAYSSAKRSVIPETKWTIASASSPRSTRESKIRRTVAWARSCSPRACGAR